MRKILSTLFLTLVLLTSFIAFFPKDKLYFFLQEKLLAYNVQVESSSVKSKAFALDIKKSYILLSGARVAKVGEIHISLLGVTLKNVQALGSFKNMVPTLKSVKIEYLPKISGVAGGDFGKIDSRVSLSEKKVIFEAKVNQAVKNRYKMIFAEFKKVGDKYVYEFSF